MSDTITQADEAPERMILRFMPFIQLRDQNLEPVTLMETVAERLSTAVRDAATSGRTNCLANAMTIAQVAARVTCLPIFQKMREAAIKIADLYASVSP